MATPTLASELTMQLNLTYLDTDDLNTSRGNLFHTLVDTLTTGTTANKADMLWYDVRLVDAAAEDLNIDAQTDAFGNTVAFVEIVGLFIHNTSTTSTEILKVGGAAGNQLINWVANSSDIVQIGPDGVLFIWNPIDAYAVTAGTGDLLKIDPGAATITYEIIVIGRSA